MKMRFFQLLLLTILSTGFAFSQNGSLRYTQMTEQEKSDFIRSEVNEFLGLFRTVGDYKIDADGADEVKIYLNKYLQRKAKTKNGKCQLNDDLSAILQRGKLSGSEIKSVFSAADLPAQAGLYLAMAESEFCPCLQSPTGALGMFQLNYAIAKEYGIDAVKGATPEKPDARCQTAKSATVAAQYLKKLLDVNFGNNSLGAPFAVTSYNMGEGMTKKLVSVANQNKDSEFTYWKMRKFDFNSTPEDILSSNTLQHFRMEGAKYFPKFLAAMIVGENPQTFGINLTPLSQK